MQFLESDFTVKILSVQRLAWGKNDKLKVMARPYSALSVRIKGNSDFFDNKHQPIHLENNDMLFMPAGLSYETRNGEEEILVVHFEITGKNQDYYEVLRPPHPETYLNLFYSLYEEWTTHRQAYYLKSMSIFYRILAHLQGQFSFQCDHHHYSKISESIKYLHEHFTDTNINVSRLCSISNISDTYYRKLFMELYDVTPLKYITDLRIKYAVELLETGYYTIEEVAEKCGFEDPKYFSSVFKKVMGHPPSSFKRNYQR